MNGKSIRARSLWTKPPQAEGQAPANPRNVRGFTLIELMVVTVIVGILAGIAGVQYRGVQVKAHLATVVADARILFSLLSLSLSAYRED